MKKSVIQIWGVAKSGKTSTVKLIHQELIKHYQNRNHTYRLPLPDGEIFIVLDCEGTKIGISSMGDVLSEELKKHLDECFDICDIIVAASRVYNDVDKYLDLKSHKKSFRRIKVTNSRIEDSESVQWAFNQESARDITNLINNIKIGRL
jgi:hypothetical protein